MNIERERYLNHALNFSAQEKFLVENYAQWLPSQIIDSHAHCNLQSHVREVNTQAFHHMMSSFPYYSLEESKKIHGLMHPNIDIRSLRFPKTFKGINHKEANLYLLNQSAERDRIAVYGLPDDEIYTCRILGHERASALKMYHSYFTPPATNVYQYFTKAILGEAQMLGRPIILHPPVIITKCLDQIIRLKDDFPDLIVVLAHLGLTKVLVPGLQNAYERLASLDGFFMDTSLVPDGAVVQLALETFGHNRILYGSDEPLNLLRSTVYVHPEKGQRIITDYQYHWVDKDEFEEYKHLSEGLCHTHWSSLKAIRVALDFYHDDEYDIAKQNVFFNNSKALFGF